MAMANLHHKHDWELCSWVHCLKTFPEAFTSFNLGAIDRVMWFLYNLSVFSLDLAELLRNNQISVALTYLGSSIIGGLTLFLLSKSSFDRIGLTK